LQILGKIIYFLRRKRVCLLGFVFVCFSKILKKRRFSGSSLLKREERRMKKL